MKILFGYTLDYIKRNRRSSFAIMVAILMTSTMMSALCGYLYTVYRESLSNIIYEIGDWHGELFGATLGNEISAVEKFESVEAVLIKGNWMTAQIEDPRRDYLIWRDANAEYWSSMPEGESSVLEGRVPKKNGEIALSKQYFEHHPELKMGDTITLPIGNRVMADGSNIAPQNVRQPDEQFIQSGEVTLTVVGKLDFTTSSTVPAYTALGFLDETTILPEDELTVYLRFHDIHDTYKELPKIAAEVGYEKDEYGNYLLRYNTEYLTRMAVLSPEQTGLLPKLLSGQMPLMYAIVGILVVGVFVLVIHNAFALSSTARLSQLGIFASVGATPKQIRQSVVMEGLLLTLIPLPAGIFLGYFAVSLFVKYANEFSATNGREMVLAVGLPSLLPAVMFTLITVWWSAIIPARKISRMSPLAAIRQGTDEKLKKSRYFSMTGFGKLFGLSGELAAAALEARKKSYRTATVSLMLSFLTLSSFLYINSASTASKAVYKTDEKLWEEQDILLSLYNITTPEDYQDITGGIKKLSGMENTLWYNTLKTAAWIPENKFSDEFEEKGGYEAVEKELSGLQIPLLRDGKRRVSITVLGLDDESFLKYCNSLGIDSAPFYDKKHWRSILYHSVMDITESTKRNPVIIPFLAVKKGDVIRQTEATSDSYKGDFNFDMEITAIADKLPPLGSASFGKRYSALQILPVSRLEELAKNFETNTAVRVEGVLRVSQASEIQTIRNMAEKICESYFGSGDYELFDEEEYYEDKEIGVRTLAILFGFIIGLLGIIGISNAWSTVHGTLQARRQEFAMLRSVGLAPKGLHRMLSLEAVILGLRPIILSFPIILIIQGLFLSLNEVSFFEWLPYAPIVPMILYIFTILSVIMLTYAIGSKKILKDNIIDAVKSKSF